MYRSMRFVLPVLAVLLLTACTPQLSLSPHAAMERDAMMQRSAQTTAHDGAPSGGLRVRTYDEGTLIFHGDDWRLTPSGIRGTADVETQDGNTYTTDTTLSYWDTAEAGPAGRQSTMGQFMLTVLGVILVLGLAAIILYAAFLATDR
ncbi:MAG: hypothetical protein RRA94_07645 [Bacteroidota bacterium]|nr:hypothetical protein [Bacteroidota bacterium]